MSYTINFWDDKWVITIPRPTDYPAITKRSLLEQIDKIFVVQSEPQAQELVATHKDEQCPNQQ